MTRDSHAQSITEGDDATRSNAAIIPLADASPADPRGNATLRRSMQRRFEVWLDDILEGEQPPAGIASEILAELRSDGTHETLDQSPDMVALWSAMMRMVEETRLQGRSFQQLHQDLEPMKTLIESVSSLRQGREEVTDQERRQLHESARDGVINEMLDLLIDIRDRLLRGSQSARRARSEMPGAKRGGLVERFRAKPAAQADDIVAALLKGYDLCREQLDEALSQHGIRAIECVGLTFDPVTMKAVDTDPNCPAEDGTVIEVYRQGYRHHGQVYRPAEVKVARRATPNDPASERNPS